MVSLKDNRLKEKDRLIKTKKEDPNAPKMIEKPQQSSALFFSYNTQLGPPYHIILGKSSFQIEFELKVNISLLS
jgi:U3 small nucleolar RNA-associated protein 24